MLRHQQRVTVTIVNELAKRCAGPAQADHELAGLAKSSGTLGRERNRHVAPENVVDVFNANRGENVRILENAPILLEPTRSELRTADCHSGARNGVRKESI